MTPLKPISIASRIARIALSTEANPLMPHAQGLAENWKQPGADGKYPAPPLNGTAHTWHHSAKGLVSTIQNGTISIGGNMPAWKGKLSR
jgi:hypothetical protein